MEEEGAWSYQGAWPRVTRRGGGAESRWASRSAAGPRPLAPPVSRHAGAHARGDVRNAIKSAASSTAGPECVGEAERSGFLRQQCLDGTGRARARRLTTSTTTSRTPTPPPPSHPILAQRHGYASLPGAPELPPGLRGGRQPPDQPGALRVLRVPQHGERGKGGAQALVVVWFGFPEEASLGGRRAFPARPPPLPPPPRGLCEVELRGGIPPPSGEAFP